VEDALKTVWVLETNSDTIVRLHLDNGKPGLFIGKRDGRFTVGTYVDLSKQQIMFIAALTPDGIYQDSDISVKGRDGVVDFEFLNERGYLYEVVLNPSELHQAVEEMLAQIL